MISQLRTGQSDVVAAQVMHRAGRCETQRLVAVAAERADSATAKPAAEAPTTTIRSRPLVSAASHALVFVYPISPGSGGCYVTL